VVGVVIDDDEASSIRGQAGSHPVGEAAIDSRDVVFSQDCTLNVRAVQQASPASLLGVLGPDEVSDRHSSIKLRGAWDGIRRERPSDVVQVPDIPQIRPFFAVKKNLCQGVDFCWRSGIRLFM